MTDNGRNNSEWITLSANAQRMNLPENHLRNLVSHSERFDRFSISGGGLFYDFSRQRVDSEVMNALFAYAEAKKLKEHFKNMVSGALVNYTENRAALHTASRDFSGRSVKIDGVDVMPDIIRVRNEIQRFAGQVHSGQLKGTTGKRFRDIVVIGIGGSYLGTEFVATALEAIADKGMRLHFLSNVDIDCLGSIIGKIDPEATLWIVISKSYTTTETKANEVQANAFIRSHGLEPRDHLVAVTAKGSPGDDPGNPVLRTFHMFDFIGGRFSVTSAVGGVPLSLYLGYDAFEAFLKGAEEMDCHVETAPVHENIAAIAALIGVWNNNFLGYSANALIPYSMPLEKLPAHIQQLYMESNGKSVTQNGDQLKTESGVLVFGEPGTNAQHSFFQLAHQGRPFPIDFIGVVQPHHRDNRIMSKGVTNHQELWANLIAQPKALAEGKSEVPSPAKYFPGNRPSSVILLNDLSPENIGRLLAFYEARTVFEAFCWNINPFDQFGVELGKKMASGIREAMAEKNRDPEHRFDDRDPAEKAYLDILFSGNL